MITFPSSAHKEFMEEYGQVEDCEEGSEYTYGDLTFVINGVEYSVPSHHWMEREYNKDKETGGSC